MDENLGADGPLEGDFVNELFVRLEKVAAHRGPHQQPALRVAGELISTLLRSDCARPYLTAHFNGHFDVSEESPLVESFSVSARPSQQQPRR